MIINILMIDDDVKLCEQTKELLDDEVVQGHSIKLQYAHTFDEGTRLLKEKNFDVVVLDLYRGAPSESNRDMPGEQVLEHIKNTCFIPVIFYSGLTRHIEHLKSDIVRVVGKGDSIDDLKREIESVVSSGLPFIKRKIEDYLNDTMRDYFWKFVHPRWSELSGTLDTVSLGYLLVRRLANSFSKEQISKLLNDSKIKPDKSHPMDFYVYPPISTSTEYEMGDIFKKDLSFFVLLTPSCDLVIRGQAGRDAKSISLVKATLLSDTEQYKAYKKEVTGGTKSRLLELIKPGLVDRYFFLPQTPFLPNCVIDFQNILVVPESDLSQYEKIAKLDDPYAQSMLANFIRHYNRIGYDDLDLDDVLKNL